MDNVEKVDLDRVDWKSSREFFESLGEALDRLDDKGESYNFTWVGKRRSIIEAGAPINKTLRPDVEASKNFDDTKNMLIVGDNLDALKLLQESYLGKIKMIYIDPPYNTGHDFVYHDNFTIKKSDFNDASTDSDGNIIISEDEYTENSKANGRFHSDWLSMMCPRLKLARNLLTDDGVIFISIDDNESANLKKLCDEVFGEDNFVSCVTVETANGVFGTRASQLTNTIVKVKDYVLIYKKEMNSPHSFHPLYMATDEPFDAHYSIMLDAQLNRISFIEWLKTNESLLVFFEKYKLNVSIDNISKLMELDQDFREKIIGLADKILSRRRLFTCGST